MQQLQPLAGQFAAEKVDAGQIAAGAGQTGDHTEPDRVLAGDRNNRDRRRCRLDHRRDAVAGRRDHVDLATH
jgi:hypothetical protein